MSGKEKDGVTKKGPNAYDFCSGGEAQPHVTKTRNFGWVDHWTKYKRR